MLALNTAHKPTFKSILT